jgi:hypothetical protein
MEQHPSASLALTGSLLMDSEGGVSRRDINHWTRRQVKQHYGLYAGSDYAARCLYWKNYVINASAVLFRREPVGDTSGAPWLDMCNCGDWLFWFDLAMRGDIIEVYEPLNYFRHHTQRATVAGTGNGNMLTETIRVVDIMDRQLPALSAYARTIRMGVLYKRIKKSRIDAARKAELFAQLSRQLHADRTTYLKERLNSYLAHFLPQLPTVRARKVGSAASSLSAIHTYRPRASAMPRAHCLKGLPELTLFVSSRMLPCGYRST